MKIRRIKRCIIKISRMKKKKNKSDSLETGCTTITMVKLEC